MRLGLISNDKCILADIRHLLACFVHNIHLVGQLGVKKTCLLIWWKYRKIVDDTIKYDRKLHELIYDYINTHYSYAINRQQGLDEKVLPNKTIWVFWWQGEDKMPQIVKKCYRSICYYSNGTKVQLITKSNYHIFVDVPDFLLQRLNKGHICHAHFSDVFRCMLLYKYGGLWLDATIMLTKPLDINIFNRDFYSIKRRPDEHGGYNSRYASFCFGTKPHNPLFGNMAKGLLEYVKKEKYFIDYFVFDYFNEMTRKLNPTCRDLVESLEYNNQQHLEIQLCFNEPFNCKKWNDVISDTYIHKLTYKGLLSEFVNGKETFYGHVVNMIIEQC